MLPHLLGGGKQYKAWCGNESVDWKPEKKEHCKLGQIIWLKIINQKYSVLVLVFGWRIGPQDSIMNQIHLLTLL